MQSTSYINKTAANSTIIHFVHFDVEDKVQHVEKSVFIIQYSVLLVCEKSQLFLPIALTQFQF